MNVEKDDIGKWFFEEAIDQMREQGAEENPFAKSLFDGVKNAYESYKIYINADNSALMRTMEPQ